MPICAAGILATAGLAGTELTASGASDQAAASAAANQQNAANVAAANQQAWAEYLLQRGIYAPNAASGTIPSGAQAVNSKLPLYANVDINYPAATSAWAKAGSAPTAPAAPAKPTWTLSAKGPGG